MKTGNVTRFIDEIAAAYPDAVRANEGSQIFLKVPKVFFPTGCIPPYSAVLVLLEENRSAPQLFIKELPSLPNGKAPRSCNPTPLGGDTWHTFSFNQPWDEDTHTAVQFVEGRLRRFALNE